MENNEAFNPYAESNKESINELCLWIGNNLDKNIGWTELVNQSGLTHKQLQFLFNKYYQTTPMTYIRKQRENSSIVSYAEKINHISLLSKKI